MQFRGSKGLSGEGSEAAGNFRVQTAGIRCSLAHLKRRITEEKKSQLWAWHDQKTKERESRKRGFYVPFSKAEMDPLLGKTKKFYASRFYQLKIGHGAIGMFLNRIEARKTAECWWCGDAEQSVIHLYTKCRKWRAERRVLRKSLGKVGIQW